MPALGSDNTASRVGLVCLACLVPMIKSVFLAIALVFWLLLTPTIASSQTQAADVGGAAAFVDRGFFLDPTGQMTLDQVRGQAFEPFGRALSLGYTSDTLWLR